MKTAIVTGASRGIGKEVALKLKNLGYNVVGSYLNSELQAKELEAFGVDIIKCNTAVKEDVEALFAKVAQNKDVIDVFRPQS